MIMTTTHPPRDTQTDTDRSIQTHRQTDTHRGMQTHRQSAEDMAEECQVTIVMVYFSRR